MQPLDRSLGTVPVDGQGRGELPKTLPLELRIDLTLHDGVDVDEPLLQEILQVQRVHEVGDASDLDLPTLLQTLDDDLLDRSAAVHHLEQLVVGLLEAEHDEIA